MDILFTFEDGSKKTLTHSGVKGMHWGKWNEETRRKYEGGKSERITRKDEERMAKGTTDNVRKGMSVSDYDIIDKTLKLHGKYEERARTYGAAAAGEALAAVGTALFVGNPYVAGGAAAAAAVMGGIAAYNTHKRKQTIRKAHQQSSSVLARQKRMAAETQRTHQAARMHQQQVKQMRQQEITRINQEAARRATAIAIQHAQRAAQMHHHMHHHM